MSEKKLKGNTTIPCPRSASQTDFSLMEHIIKSLPDSIYWKDKDGTYLGCNKAMLELAGMKSLEGKTDLDMPWANSALILRENEHQAMKLKRTLELEETRTIANGQQAILLTKTTPLLDERGDSIGIIGTLLNITIRKQREFDLHSSQDKIASTLENIVANMPGHVYWKDQNGVYLGCNNRQAQSLGYKYGSELVGKTDFDLPWGENQAERFRQNDRRIMDTGIPIIIEEKAQVDGENAIVLSHKSPMRNKRGEITGLLGISINISEQKKIEAELRLAKEQAETASHTKTEFLENMRHDIRTPLTGIVGFSDLIKSEADNPQIKEYADNLQASSHALLDLLDEVLEAIQVSSGEIPNVKKKFVLHNILQHALNLNKAKAGAKHLELSLEFDESIPNYLIGDNVRIHRIALELIANALNFTDSGFVKISAKLAYRENRDVTIKLIVSDSGIGIPKDKQQDIYLQFKRLTPSYKGIYKGAGLGLSVIKQFINDLDGEIYVDSELHKGTTFICVLPLKVALLDEDTGVQDDFESYGASPAPQIPISDANQRPMESKSELNKSCILVVEDNIIAQTVTKAILLQFNCHVDIAENGQVAIRLWDQNTYDLIFMDIGLPDMDGYQLTHYIRAQESTKKSHTPIIALTAHVGEENMHRCIESGMNRVLSKPLSLNDCHDILSSFTPTTQMTQETKRNKFTADLPETENNLFALSSFPILDIQDGIKTTGSEAALFETLQFMIKDSLPGDFAMLQKIHGEGDWEKTQKLAHKIKGGVVYVGAVRMKMACQYLERYWKSGQRVLLEPLYQQLIQVTNESISEINQWIKSKLHP